MSGRVWTTTKETEIGVQRRGRVPSAVPREPSPTNSEEMKNILAQIREMPDGFPFETTIKTETFGKGRTKYVFT